MPRSSARSIGGSSSGKGKRNPKVWKFTSCRCESTTHGGVCGTSMKTDDPDRFCCRTYACKEWQKEYRSRDLRRLRTTDDGDQGSADRLLVATDLPRDVQANTGILDSGGPAPWQPPPQWGPMVSPNPLGQNDAASSLGNAGVSGGQATWQAPRGWGQMIKPSESTVLLYPPDPRPMIRQDRPSGMNTSYGGNTASSSGRGAFLNTPYAQSGSPVAAAPANPPNANTSNIPFNPNLAWSEEPSDYAGWYWDDPSRTFKRL